MSGTRRHIALFIYGLAGGGAQRRTVTLANGFAARGHRVDLVVVHAGGVPAQAPSPAVRVVALAGPGIRALRAAGRWVNLRGLATASSTWPLARYLRRERPEVLLSAASHVNLVAVWARRLSGVPVPLVLRASNHPSGNLFRWPATQRPIRWALQAGASRIYPWADAVVAVSQGVARQVVDLTGVSPERVTPIYNPVVDGELLAKSRQPVGHPWVRSPGAPVILGVGTLKLQKDFPTLVRAFARVRAHRPARLVILGEGRERGALEHLAASLGVARDVCLPGYTPNPFAWMARAAVFVLSSAWEGLPGALVEAMACGCPVVSTDCPDGPAEILDGGRYGPLVPVGDDRALAEAIEGVLDAPPDRDGLRRRAAELCSVEPAVDRYLEVLEAAIAARHPAPRQAAT
ncbi:MAG: glycosyltransferase [Deferrisomatales bacterium]